LVAIAEMEKPVRSVIDLAITRMIRALRTPACPTTKPARMNMITPKMVSIDGVNTPPNVPNFFAPSTGAAPLSVTPCTM
jgi:hypothetical protein